jgi:hypothetical protein
MTAKKNDEQKPDANADAAPPVDATPTTPPEPQPDAAVETAAPPEPPAQPEPIAADEAETVVYRYRGPGTVAGVPPRDVTRLDVERLVPEQIRAMVLAAPGRAPLYEAV